MPSHSTKGPSHPQQRGSGEVASSADRIEWSRSTILGFIEDYRRQRVLWDPNTKGYHIKQIKYEALKQLGLKYGTEIRSIRSKIKSLRSSFHREHGKVINGKRRGIHYQPMWFAYEAIRFILDGEQHRPYGGGGGGGGNDDDSESEAKREAARNGYEVGVGVGAEADVGIGLGLGLGLGIGDGGRAFDGRLVGAELETGAVAMAAAEGADVDDGDDDDDEEDEEVEQKHEKRVAVAAAAAALRERSEEAARHAGRCDGDGDGEGHGNVVAAAALGAGRVGSDGETSRYCNISAEDVKTELIESESPEPDKSRAPSPLSYLAMVSAASPSGTRRRKRPSQPDARPPSQHRDSSSPPSPSKVSRQDQGRGQESPLAQSSPAGGGGSTGQVDEYGVFGEYVAITIRKLKTSKAKIVVKHLINNLLYEAELGKYDYGIAASKEPPQLYQT